ncbi:hypothetical protein M011DRAFT_475378 [Sporormia fimetaria CBS 119925]|uniref:YTH domain-containing protein n=1 Tax=Sporormia fimetaria CBS 119925 TaxID=1340428 RepID=A0A6A6VHJ7_9PLEO|nr:hypothetical protein M011DRAFT_475378 [Sporormia fimetaria CBS 119925]
MAFVWVQQWVALPIVLEEQQMGDVPAGMTPQSLDTTTNTQGQQGPSFKSTGNTSPYQPQLPPPPRPHVRHDLRSPTHHAGANFPAQEPGGAALSMIQLAGALPDYSAEQAQQTQQHVQRPISGASTPALVYQLQQNLQLPGHGSNHLPPSAFAGGQYQQTFVPGHNQPSTYGAFHPTQRGPHPNTFPASYQNFQQPSQYMYYPSPYAPQGQMPHGFTAQAVQSQPLYGRRPSLTTGVLPMMGQSMEVGSGENQFAQGLRFMHTGSSGVQRPGPVSTVPRGPPRKPKQSGHALWVGNLPPGTTVVALKDHFSRDATKDIESLFLISKSNCAFVNYRTEESCTAAMHRFHDSRFNGVRLVCRLRRSSTPASGVPTGPSAMAGQSINAPQPKFSNVSDGVDGEAANVESTDQPHADNEKPTTNAKDRYFVLKSLTLQDLETSVRNGIWSTQSHNEKVLNKAFEDADNVYLIFSANKSGEYFGYARMASPILEDATIVMGPAPKAIITNTTADTPKSIATPATEFAPRGRIIDDSARGTIFWEAVVSDTEGDDVEASKEDVHAEGDAAGVPETWGKPFRVEWLSTNRLPFYRVRGLRNPWNSDREVKIARDGTELETSVGERLLQMFHRLGPPSGQAPLSGSMMASAHLGPSQMRPH